MPPPAADGEVFDATSSPDCAPQAVTHAACADCASLRAHVERVEQSLRAQGAIAEAALADARSAHQRADAAHQRAEAAEAVSLGQQAQSRALRMQVEALARALAQHQLDYAAIEQSNSWRLTLPLRLFRKAVGRKNPPAVAPTAASASASGEDAAPVTSEPSASPTPGLAEATEMMRAAARHWSLGQRR